MIDDIAQVPEDLEDFYERRKESNKHQGDWRKEARGAYEFREGNQWSADDRAMLEEQNRPCVTFNRVAPVLDSIVGHEVNNRREVRYIPRTMEDREVNAVFTDAAQWVRDGCDAEDEETEAYSDAVTVGMGWIETRVDYDDDPEGTLIMERVSPLEMRWDTTSRKNNVADANWLMRESWVPIEEVRADYPDADIEPQFDTVNDSDWTDEHDASNAWQYRDNQNWYDPKTGKVLLIQYQYREKEPYHRVGDAESGRVLEFSADKFEKLESTLEKRGAPSAKLRRWKYRQQFIVGDTILEEGDCPIDNGFSFRCITAKRDEEHGTWFGLMRAMKDPQKWANAFFSQAMYTLQANAKGGVMVEDTAVQDKREFEDKWADPAGVSYVEDGALSAGRIQPKPMGAYPPQLDKLMQVAIQSIRDVTGVNMELLGMVGHEQAGVLEVERKKSALTILAPLVNSLKRYRKMQGRDLLSFMRRYIKPGTVMRLSNRPAQAWTDDDTVKYDVIVDDAVSSPNLKEEVWGTMQNILPAMVKAGVPIPPDLIRFSPLPDTVADSWVEYISEQEQAPDIAPLQQQLQKMQEELGKLQQENMMLKDKREAQAMQLQYKQQEAALNAQIKEQEMALSARQAEQELLFKQQISDADRQAKLLEIQARYDTEMAKIQAESEVKVATATMQTDTQKDLQVVNLQHERERREAERTDKYRDETNPHIDQIVDTASKLDKVAEEFEEYRDEAAKSRKIILDFLTSKGGDIAQVAKRLK